MPEIIAEIGQNHNGDLSLAIELVHLAKEAGADTAKFQIFDAPALFPRKDNPWFEYNCKAELSQQDVRKLAETCEQIGIEFMASVFDPSRVQWMEEVGVKRYKVASRSVKDKPLLQALANTGKPLIVSLGMWEENHFPKIPGVTQVDYLYCVSKYPTPLTDLHLSHIDFETYDGFSDHSLGTEAAMVALSRGAKIIEKHFTKDKSMYGPDHACSMTPNELKQLSEFRCKLDQCLK